MRKTRRSSAARVLVILCVWFSLVVCSEADTLQVDYVGSHEILSEQKLLEFVPQSLRTYKFAGKEYRVHRFAAYVVPARDSGGLQVDTVSEKPDFLFVLYSTGSSVLTILKKAGNRYVQHWSSEPMIGDLGQLFLKDLDADGNPEISVSLQYGAKLRPNVFLFSWDAGRIRTLNPSGKASGLSEFSFWVDFMPSDTGLTITAIRDGAKKTYFLRNHTGVIRLVSEEQLDKKQR